MWKPPGMQHSPRSVTLSQLSGWGAAVMGVLCPQAVIAATQARLCPRSREINAGRHGSHLALRCHRPHQNLESFQAIETVWILNSSKPDCVSWFLVEWAVRAV